MVHSNKGLLDLRTHGERGNHQTTSPFTRMVNRTQCRFTAHAERIRMGSTVVMDGDNIQSKLVTSFKDDYLDYM